MHTTTICALNTSEKKYFWVVPLHPATPPIKFLLTICSQICTYGSSGPLHSHIRTYTLLQSNSSCPFTPKYYFTLQFLLAHNQWLSRYIKQYSLSQLFNSYLPTLKLLSSYIINILILSSSIPTCPHSIIEQLHKTIFTFSALQFLLAHTQLLSSYTPSQIVNSYLILY